MELRELHPADDDFELLRRFYDSVYVAEFPDPNERESYENMVVYLQSAGSNANGYHIVLAIEAGRPAGCSVTDYFTGSNTGVIEFLAVDPELRGRGLGSRLLHDAEQRVCADARRADLTVAFIAAEINDPFKPAGTPDNLDPFERARWWGRRGYGRLVFPYVQPALSAGQQSACNLMLAVKTFADDIAREEPGGEVPALTVPACAVDAFVRDYLRYAMRIDDPDASPEYVEMARSLLGLSAVSLMPMRAYVG